jgi:hypothetical protein
MRINGKPRRVTPLHHHHYHTARHDHHIVEEEEENMTFCGFSFF